MLPPQVLIPKLRDDPHVQLIDWAPDDGLMCTVRLGFDRRRYNVIAAWGAGWDHVSVSLHGNSNTTPSWKAMSQIKLIFFQSHECAVAYHPGESDYINIHPGTLHWWRKQEDGWPEMPPQAFV